MMVVLNSRMVYSTGSGASNDAAVVSTELSAVSFGGSAFPTTSQEHEQRSDPYDHSLEDFKTVSGHYSTNLLIPSIS